MRNKPLLLLCYAFFAFQLYCKAQLQFFPATSIPVTNGNNNLTNAWAGGLNNAQISNVDLNRDGKKDLFIFDRARNSPSVYLNQNNNYVFAPTYADSFPAMTSWAFLIDFNNDGKADIFTSNATLTQNKNSFRVYQNTGTNQLEFTLIKEEIKSQYYGNTNSLYVTGSDVPTFADVDSDGDIDLLIFDVTGGSIQLHSNYSQELYSNSDSLNYILTNACWGNVHEDPFSSALTLNQTCSPITLKTELHAGSTLCAFDYDNDNDQDILVGDVLFNGLTFAVNGGTATNANITSQDASFPNYNTPININSFPAAFIADIDQNSKNDILISPNNKNDENYNCLHYYKNTSNNSTGHFELQQKDFLVNTMLDFGSGAYPVFFDYNSDGLLDLLVANDYIYDASNQIGKIALLINTGTNTNPSFNLQENDMGTLSQYNITSMKPTFGDLDDDGDDDMLIGAFNGQIHYFKNIAGAGNTANFKIETPIYQSIDVGAYSTPSLFDVDNDGLLDLIIGEQDGNLNYYRNTGSASTPIFTLQNSAFGNVNVSDGFLSGYSVPFLYKNGSNTELLVGCANGSVKNYTNIDGNLNGTFTLNNSSFNNIQTGIQCAASMAKITGDDKYFLVAGNKAGGLQLFSEVESNSINELSNKNLINSYYYNQKIFLSFDDNIRVQNISVFNVLGEEVFRKTLNENEKNIDVKPLASGCYISKISFSQNRNNYFAFLKFVQ
ncbi:MAG: FG-GAP repeat domain-containing protein [Flavobacteriales bacterium]